MPGNFARLSWMFLAGLRVRRLAEGNPDGAPPERLEQVRNRATCSVELPGVSRPPPGRPPASKRYVPEADYRET